MALSVRCLSQISRRLFDRRLPRLLARPVWIHMSSVRFADIDAEFTKAKERLSTLSKDPGNEVKLQLYALFKQATAGKVSKSRPGMMDFVGRAKWDAWNSLGDMTQEEAKKKYVETINGLLSSSQSSPTADEDTLRTSDADTEDVIFKRDGKVNIIQFNRPSKKNALKIEMYEAISDMFDRGAKDDSTLSVITGTGDFYCSGNDLSNFTQINPSEIAEHAEKGGRILQRFVDSFIAFPKPIIAVINGPALGISVTVLGLCDIVFATDRATFHTPFGGLGQTPEGCSTYMFPMIMGQAKANEVLLFNKKLTAVEACERGLVTKVFPDESFQKEVWTIIKQWAELPPQTMHLSKSLIRGHHKDILHKVNAAECKQLVERWQSDECINAIMAFFQKK